ncbi:glycosyltransferase family 2 protein [Lichenihabitans psoromatis]|uniref:glycosyltransferase family 2 protein n=1 Tax=Lichenihabitans psoromatis TaxID=2528642 RepID=UPI001036B28A|nr:glycosyltransferase [Lichenihabitans psoromatis]
MIDAPLPHTVAVLIATRGRPAILKTVLALVAAQTRVPDRIVVAATEEADVVGLDLASGVTVTFGPAGLTRQRNRAMATAAGVDLLIFFDDDFLPSRFWVERVLAAFASHPTLVVLTGAVLADGIKSAGITPEAGLAMLAKRDGSTLETSALQDGIGPYGCNMAFRASAIAGLRFDERLPLYGWLEDADFGALAAQRGMVARAEDLWGIHLGHKPGRVSGKRLGYSQIVNPIYLARKGTVPSGFAAKLMTKNIVANALKSLAPEPWIDRAGRLRGNLVGLADILRGRVTPERAAEL